MSYDDGYSLRSDNCRGAAPGQLPAIVRIDREFVEACKADQRSPLSVIMESTPAGPLARAVVESPWPKLSIRSNKP